MATEAARLQTRNPQQERRKTGLTLTGLLMEGPLAVLGLVTVVLGLLLPDLSYLTDSCGPELAAFRQMS